jgi:diaminohydroxyphosphoribosylaminopyrimidine deaminase / 5-amino-6-(5-phosphoribosylamino)uracil reductase
MRRDDEDHMRKALGLALEGWGRASPNPLVGALVIHEGRIVGRGWYAGPAGSPHAEVRALSDAGERAAGSTVVSTLEPCCHQGSTPPCTQALIRAGVSRVVVASRDPNPIVDGRGIGELRAAGIDVETGVLERDARRLNEAFEKHITTGSPFVTLKMASSLDGKVAAADGSSQWITGEPARADVQRLRAGADAVVVGAGTAINDDPALTVRDPSFADASPPLRVLVDARGRVGPVGKIFDDEAPTLVATTERAPHARVRAWKEAGAEVLMLDPDPAGGASVGDLLSVLGKRDLISVLVEGGPALAWSFARDGMIDKVVLYLAPLFVGGSDAPSALMGDGFAPIGRARRLHLSSVERIGEDLRVEAYVHRDR